jgi:hypothetical protein
MARGRKGGTRSSRSRRSKGESFTGAQESAAEVRTAAEDKALPALDDYKFHKDQILDAAKRKETANGNYRNSLKAAQKAGIDTDAMLKAEKLKRANDPAKMKAHFDQLAMALEEAGYPIAITAHDKLVGTVQQAAEIGGYRDATSGKFADCKYPANSDLERLYHYGFKRGTIERVKMPDEEKAKLLEEAKREFEAQAAGDADDDTPPGMLATAAPAAAESVVTH